MSNKLLKKALNSKENNLPNSSKNLSKKRKNEQ
jgi:hypothetical protein